MEGKVAQTIATAVHNMPSPASSTTAFEASPAHNPIPNGSSKEPAVKPMEIESNPSTSHNQPTTSSAATTAPKSNDQNSPKASPAKSRSRSGSKKQPLPKPDIALDTKVEVSGYPAYAKPQDLYKVFSSYGPARVEHVGRRYAVVAFDSREAARAAVNDSMQLCLYSQFLVVKPFNGAIDEQKKQVYKSKHIVATVAPDSIELQGSFGAQLAALLAAVRLSQQQVAALATLYADLERVLQPMWPGCQAVPFGSITTGLGVKSSDADCFVCIPPQFRYGYYNFVNKAKRILQQYPELFAEVFAIPRANTPIVKLFHLPTRTHCDLTFKTPLGALNSRLVARLLHADPRLLPLAVTVKYWASAHAISGSGRLTNYALTLLLVFYLQCRGALPPVARLQRPAPPLLVDGWNAAFLEDPALFPPPDAAPLEDLLGGFFRFYDGFDFENDVVCPFLGRPVPKAHFLESSLPDEFERYVRNVADGLAAPLRTKVPVCVQDPFEQCHNVASSVTPRMAEDLRAYIRFGAELYEREKPNECEGLLRALLLEKPKVIRAKTAPEYRVTLYPKMLEAIERDDWTDALREALFDVFERMLRLKLTPVGEKEALRNGREKERYSTTMTTPLWKRKQYSRLQDALRLGFVERQARITDEIAAAESGGVPVEFHVALSYCTKVRSAWVSVRMIDGDVDAFCSFGKYFLATVQNWMGGALRAARERTDPPPDDAAELSDEPREQSREEPREQSREEPREQSREEPREQSREEPREKSREEPREQSREEPLEQSREEPTGAAERDPSPPQTETIRSPTPDC